MLHEQTFSLCENSEATIYLYGKHTGDYQFGVSAVQITLADGRQLALDIPYALGQYWDSVGTGYTEALTSEGGLIVEDVNFDGYADIGLQVQTDALNLPYIYWCYDPQAESYCYLGDYPCRLTVDPQEQSCTVDYHYGQTYYLDIYKPEGLTLTLVERQITEYIDGQEVTRIQQFPLENS